MAGVLSDAAVAEIKELFRDFYGRNVNERARRPRHSGVAMNIVLAKTTTAHNKGATETIDIYSGTTKGSETTTGDSPDAYNRFADLATAKWCVAVFINGGWELIAGEC